MYHQDGDVCDYILSWASEEKGGRGEGETMVLMACMANEVWMVIQQPRKGRLRQTN